MTATDLLPVKPEVFQILLRLVEGDSHGYEMMRDIAESTGGEVRMLPGALYRHLHRMLERGLIEEIEPGDGGGDERRRHYRITDFGREVAAAEAHRLARLVQAARAHDLLGGR